MTSIRGRNVVPLIPMCQSFSSICDVREPSVYSSEYSVQIIDSLLQIGRRLGAEQGCLLAINPSHPAVHDTNSRLVTFYVYNDVNEALMDPAESEADAFMRVCCYHRRDFDQILIRPRPHEKESDILPLLMIAPSPPPPPSLGLLDRLPVELVSLVLETLSVASFFRLRQAS